MKVVKKGEVSERFKHYPKTDLFSVIDSLSVPHSYCITPKHVAYASDYYNGLLNEDSIRGAEENGILCGTCELPRDKHEQVLLINCKMEDKKGLYDYLLLIKSRASEEGFVGFAFKKGW